MLARENTRAGPYDKAKVAKFVNHVVENSAVVRILIDSSDINGRWLSFNAFEEEEKKEINVANLPDSQED